MDMFYQILMSKFIQSKFQILEYVTCCQNRFSTLSKNSKKIVLKERYLSFFEQRNSVLEMILTIYKIKYWCCIPPYKNAILIL